MGYLISIKTAVLVFPFIALLFTLPFILHQYHNYGSINKLRVLIIYSFILYMICIYFLVILPLPDRNEVTTKLGDMMRIRPFSFIEDIIKESTFVLSDPSTYLKALTQPCVYTVLYNILMTVPFGMYMRYYFECDVKRTVALSFTLSLFFELTQLTGLYFIYPGPYRFFDVDDLLMNTLGGLIGYLLMGLLHKILPSRRDIDEQSLRDGMKVSGLRRFTADFLDIIIYSFISIFFRKNGAYKIIFMIYFVVIPLFSNGQTLGRRFLNISLSFSKNKNLAILLRVLLIVLYYLGLPLGLIVFARSLKGTITHSIYLNLGIIIFIPMFYFINLILILNNKKMFYNRLFGVEYVSTIKVIDDDNRVS